MNATKTKNATSRSKGAVGPNALVPRVVENYFGHSTRGLRVLDYGAGKHALHAERMKQAHPDWKVLTVECGDNFDSLRHNMTPDILRGVGGHFDVAYASNVLNVQTTWRDVVEVVADLHNSIHQDGFVVVNLPISPRKAAWSHSRASNGVDGTRERSEDADALRALLSGFFGRIELASLCTKSAPVFVLGEKIEPMTNWERNKPKAPQKL